MTDEYPCAVPYDPESRSRWRQLLVEPSEYAARLDRVRDEMANAKLDGLLVVGNPGDPANMSYLANYAPHFGTTLLLVPLDGDPVVVSDAILHGEPMHSMLWDVLFNDLRPAANRPGRPPGSVTEIMADALREKGLDNRAVGIVSPATLSFSHGDALRSELPDVEWRDATLCLLRPRAIKSPAEIAYLRKACDISRQALDAGVEACRPGATEREVANVMHETMMRLGSEDLGFDTAVSSGPRAGLKHAPPTERRLESGDLVFLDTGAVIGGYHADLSRTPGVGQLDSDAQEMLEAAVEMFRACLKVIKPGAPVRDIYRAAERTARRAGLIGDYMPNGLGHGVGRALFELPFLGPDDDSILETGMTFALEPMLVRYGVGTAVIEETVLVTDDGVEILSGAEW